MRTLIISDLHLGNGGPHDVFAGGEALPSLLDRAADGETRIMVNGDGMDFLMNDDPLTLDPARAEEQARAIVRAPASAGVLRAMGRALARGGEVIFRIGNHDVELCLPSVQAVVRGALGQPAEVAERLVFQPGNSPAILDVGGARILVTHGEHGDPWNRVDYGRLSAESPARYEYSPGSTLVKRLLNPVTNELGMRFVSLLKPDFQGGVLTALAVSPAAVKVLLAHTTAEIVWGLVRRAGMGATFDEAEDDELGLAARIAEAGLSPDEQGALVAMLGDGPASFSDEEEGALSRAMLKIARGGLKLYSKAHRWLAGEASEGYFSLAPDVVEIHDAERLARRYRVSAVITGHTHAARWRAEGGLVMANSGTWIHLMRLPSVDAGDDAWADFVEELRRNPRLSPDEQRVAKTLERFTAVLLCPAAAGGAEVSLVEWDGASLHELGSATVARAGGS